MSVSVVVWDDRHGLTDRLERLRGTVTVVRRCDELTEVVALAETGLAHAALLAGDTAVIDAASLDALHRLGVPALVLTDDLDERRRLSSLGAGLESTSAGAQSIADLLELLCGAPPAPGGPRDRPGGDLAAGPAESTAPGRIVAVWGSGGSPGRTTLAVNLAVEAALAGQRVLVLDCDTYAASVAVHLGLLDESAGVAQLCRLADQGVLDRPGFERACPEVAVAGARMRVATGLPRASRWPELRSASLARVLAYARRRADLVVVDIAPYVERDEDLSFDTAAPQRNAATLAVLEDADEVLAVGQGDSVGVPRLVKALEELREILPDAAARVVFNKVRASSVGHAPERQLRETWERFGPSGAVAGFLPWDGEAADRALLAGSALAESAPASALRTAVAGLAGTGVPRRRRLLGRRPPANVTFPPAGG
ncbi:AAA family ATPase [Arthrobacter halodurans]|uniref:CpaE family protein n=1 Tax=Arthrobacter halodurans TaxID=516699 RepID=A0ABV4UJF4_9MICC